MFPFNKRFKLLAVPIWLMGFTLNMASKQQRILTSLLIIVETSTAACLFAFIMFEFQYTATHTDERKLNKSTLDKA